MTHATHLLRAGLLAAFVAAVLACGGGLPDDDDDDVPSCDMAFSVVTDPDSPTEEVGHPGVEMVVTGQISSNDITGFQLYEWGVELDDVSVPFDSVSPNGDVIELTPERTGVYTISLGGSVGGLECDAAGSRDVNVVEEGAQPERFILRVVPAPGDDVAPQDRSIQIFGGGNGYALGPVVIAEGVSVGGVSSDALGQPVPAYVRAWPSPPIGGAPLLLSEIATGDDGAYDLQLVADDEYDVLVVPASPELAPYALHGAPDAIPLATTFEPGDPVSGTVVDGDGAPVVGARVSLVVGGLPSSIAVTDEAGGFALQMRAGASLSVIVTPPDASGLPQLELTDAEVGVAAGSAIAVAYGAALTARAVAPVVREADGATPSPGSRVTWIGRPIESAGTIVIDGEPPLAAIGRVRHTVEAGPGGDLPSILLPAALYDVVVDPPADATGQAVALVAVDLSEGEPAPAALDLAAPAELRGSILAPGQEGDAPLAGVRVQAAPRGILANSTGAVASARTAADGSFSLALAGGGDYEITADATAQRQGRVRWTITAPAPGVELDIEPAVLPRVLRATGQLIVPSGGGVVAGAHLQLFCSTCAPDGGADAVAETLTDGAGGFELMAPDPGVVISPAARH